jgi:hypothetical protein
LLDCRSNFSDLQIINLWGFTTIFLKKFLRLQNIRERNIPIFKSSIYNASDLKKCNKKSTELKILRTQSRCCDLSLAMGSEVKRKQESAVALLYQE